jgi:carbon monoxide dehydrogenase subunit G
VIIDERVVVQAPPERVWDFTMDITSMARCLPGVEKVEQLDSDTFSGSLKVRVGPVSMHFEGRIRIVERDREMLRARMEIEAADRRIKGSLRAKAMMQLEPLDDGTTVMSVHTDAAVLGKLGEFGQAVMRRKASEMLRQFATNLSAGATGMAVAEPSVATPPAARPRRRST